jgi:hypothetical protein
VKHPVDKLAHLKEEIVYSVKKRLVNHLFGALLSLFKFP